MKFEPIAIIGRGCILPGCQHYKELWQTIEKGHIHINGPSGGSWRINLSRILGDFDGDNRPDTAWSDRGGYIHDFERLFDPYCSLLDGSLLSQLDPLVQWSVFAGKQALDDYGRFSPAQGKRTGVILGNLSYPSAGHSKLAESILLKKHLNPYADGPHSHYLNRFNSGLPAILLAKALGLEGGAFALDAACASGLYAIKLACDRLQSRSTDLMLAGAVNAADPLFIHVGFSALKALSISGQSRPFHRDADGLVPAEGSAFVLLKRLEDAISDGDPIAGVIRGIGLSNDGRTGGFLSPSVEGQVRCMKQAYESACISPSEISYVECHATGTPTGDSTEIKSMSNVFRHEMAIGSLKANLGHLITTSGVAGLLKVLGGLEHRLLPPTPAINPASDTLSNSTFHLMEQPESWPSISPIVAGISSFGFGGNNAHLIVSPFEGVNRKVVFPQSPLPKREVAVVAMEAMTHLHENMDSLLASILGKKQSSKSSPLMEHVSFTAKELAFPPSDLKQALGQQLLLHKTAQTALRRVTQMNASETGVYIGMGTDSEIGRLGLRLRLRDLLEPAIKDEQWIKDAESAISDPLTAAGVVGKMPNIPANRLNNQFNFQGPGFTVSREELSGDTALDLAIHAIKHGEISTAVVGAVDLSRETVHEAVLEQCNSEKNSSLSFLDLKNQNFRERSADAAVVLILKDLESAKKDGESILAILDENDQGDSFTIGNTTQILTPKTGHAHAASGLLHHAVGIGMLHSRQVLNEAVPDSIHETQSKPLLPRDGYTRMTVQNKTFGNESIKMTYSAGDAKSNDEPPSIKTFAGNSQSELLHRLENDQESREGNWRCAIVGFKHELDQKRKQALYLLQNGKMDDGWNKNGIFFREKPISGEMAFAFTGAASAYPNMGKDLLNGMPILPSILQKRLTHIEDAIGWAYRNNDPRGNSPFYQLAGSSVMCQCHSIISRDFLNITPQAVLGLSSGETNSMFAFDVWSDMDGLFKDIKASGLYDQSLGGDFQIVQQHWGSVEPIQWDNWRLLASVSEVSKAVAAESRVYLTIINTKFDCVIGGDRAACQRVLKLFPDAQSLPLGHDIAVHCAAVEPFKDQWHRIHTRKSNPPENLRFYSNYYGDSYDLSTTSVADALTGQAFETVNFPRIIEKAWLDGVRIFLEHGPRNSLSTSINTILGDKPHCAIPMDRMGVNGLVQAHCAAAELWCAGVQVNLEQFTQMAGGHVGKQPEEIQKQPSISFLLRPKIGSIRPLKSMAVNASGLFIPPELHAGPDHGKRMIPAPVLARVSSSFHITPKNKEALRSADFEPPSMEAISASEPSQNQSVTSGPKNKPALANSSVSTLSPIDLIVAAHQQMTEDHQHYLNKQNEAFQKYTALMEQMQQTLLSKMTKSVIPSDQLKKRFPKSVKFLNKEGPGNSEPNETTPEMEAQFQKSKPIQHPIESQKPGPKLDRQQLITLSRGNVSSILGSLFEQQDKYPIQVRMPEPPLLLCDRVLGIDGEPGKLGTGTIWTETDVMKDSWYLHHGRMPSGIFIEAGQADLLLISWLGIDFINKGERAYRLLGCELVFHGDLPEPGDTLSYEIKVDGHAKQGDVRLFFFHYDCNINGKKRISVRHGQAGFFSVNELEKSSGVLWQADKAEYTKNPSLPEHPVLSDRRQFTREQVVAYTEGNLVACFGDAFYHAFSHTRTPRSPGGSFNFIGEVTEFDPTGGPAGRGYLRAESPVHPSDWFFEGHFKNDPCMPGTLMADACLQMMAFYLSATGRTLNRDGWRFQPVQNTKFLFICRGQVLPESKRLSYEVFVDEIIDGEKPILFAHVLCSVDGRKAFLCERFGLQLVPDWPINQLVDWSKQKEDCRPLADINGFKLDHRSLLNCAWGKPSHAFGNGFRHFDGAKRAPRLPGPPYHFMTRITSLTGEMGAMATGSTIEVLYDIPPDAWYFKENATATMPFCVLMELALQPCGWLSSYSLSPEASRNELLFRNLDGNLILHREVLPNDGTIKTYVTLDSLSKAGEMIILSFKVICRINDETIAEMDTVFGFFPPQTMRTQKGLPISESDRNMLDMKSDFFVDLTPRTGKYFEDKQLKLPSSKLLMLDRITGYWSFGGKEKCGLIRAEKTVHPEEWFFKAHFFQDPVQPGSLGIEAIIQLIQIMMIEKNAAKNIPNPRFEPINIDGKIEWHYRGQVVPKNRKVTIVFEALKWGNTQEGPYVMGEAAYWVDGLKIYHAPEIGMRIVSSKATHHKKEIDWGTIRNYWISRNQQIHRFIHDLASGLLRQFVDHIVFEDLLDFEQHKGKPILFLANHETSIESFLFLTLMGQLTQTPIKAIAKEEHRDSWIGLVDQITQTALSNPLDSQDQEKPGVGILFFDRSDPAQLLEILAQYKRENRHHPTSLLVHSDGTRASYANQPVRNVSNVFLDCAMDNNLPIIPICFTGALPQHSTNLRLDIPYGMNKQTYIIGKSICPESLSVLKGKERRQYVLDRLNRQIKTYSRPANGTVPGHQPIISQKFRGILKTLPGICDETKELLSLKDSDALSMNKKLCLKLLS